MAKVSSAEEYIELHPAWKEELKLIRELLLNTELDESIKWGVPYYSLNGKNVVGIAAFKKHVAVWFVNGVYLNDPQNHLINAQKGVTKANRQLRFTKEKQPDKSLIKNFVLQAIANQKAGKELKPSTQKELNIPPELQSAFSENPSIEQAYKAFTPYKQKEFAEYISEAKRASTKQKRLSKIIPLIEDGVGLNDKYRS